MKSITYVFIGGWTSFNDYSYEERRNRHLAAKIKRDETERIYYDATSQMAAINKHNASHFPTAPPFDFSFTWYFPDRKKDPDSMYFMAKCVLDGLVLAHVLPNDTQQYVGRLYHERPQVDEKNPRIEVVMSEQS